MAAIICLLPDSGLQYSPLLATVEEILAELCKFHQSSFMTISAWSQTWITNRHQEFIAKLYTLANSNAACLWSS